MKLKSSIIIENLSNQGVSEINLTNDLKLSEIIIDGKNIEHRYYKQEVENIISDLNKILECNISKITIKNININESPEMDLVMKKIGENVGVLKIQNSYIGNLDLYMSAVSNRIGKNYSLSEKQYIKEFIYNKRSGTLLLAARNLDILSEICRYKNQNMLFVKLFDLKDTNAIVKYKKILRDSEIKKVVLSDSTSKKEIELSKYQNFLNKKVILLQSELLKKSLGLEKLPTNLVSNILYNININGEKVNNECIYVLTGNEQEYFIQDMKDISKFLNVGKFKINNVVFEKNYNIDEVIEEVEQKVILKEEIIQYFDNSVNVNKKPLFKIIYQKICKLFNIGLNRNQKLLTSGAENNKI